MTHLTITARRVGALAGAVLLFACQDVTAPLHLDKTLATLNAPDGSSGRVVVTPDSMRGWAFYDDQRGVACAVATACHITGTYAGNSGSVELATSAATEGYAIILPG